MSAHSELLTRALSLLTTALAPAVQREWQRVYGARGASEAEGLFGPVQGRQPVAKWDAAMLLRAVAGRAKELFPRVADPMVRSLAHEVIEWRNRWAHQKPLSAEDAHRALDSMARLLRILSATAAVVEIERLTAEIDRLAHDQAGRETSVRAPDTPAAPADRTTAAAGAATPLPEGLWDGFRSLLDQRLREGPLNEAAIRIALATALAGSDPRFADDPRSTASEAGQAEGGPADPGTRWLTTTSDRDQVRPSAPQREEPAAHAEGG